MPEKSQSDLNELTIHVQKISSFKQVHADGVMGSTTPHGHGLLAFFVERDAMPEKLIFRWKTGAEDKGSTEVVEEDGLVREVHTGITMTREGLEQLKGQIERLIEGLVEEGP